MAIRGPEAAVSVPLPERTTVAGEEGFRQRSNGARPRPQAIVTPVSQLLSAPTSRGGASSPRAGCPPDPPPRAFRELLHKASEGMNSKNREQTGFGHRSGPGDPTCPRTPSQGVHGRGEKVTSPSGNWRSVHTLKAEPYSYLAQRAGKRDLRMLARRLWSRVLAEELGARREEGGPRRAGRAACYGARPRGCRQASAGERCTRRARSRGPAFPPPAGAQGAPASKLETRPPGASFPSPASRVSPLGPQGGAGWGRWHYEAGSQMPGLSGRDSGGAVGSQASGPRPPAGGREGGETRAPAAPRADPGEQALRRKAPALGYDGHTSPPPRVLSVSNAPQSVPSPSCARRAASSDLG